MQDLLQPLNHRTLPASHPHSSLRKAVTSPGMGHDVIASKAGRVGRLVTEAWFLSGGLGTTCLFFHGESSLRLVPLGWIVVGSSCFLTDAIESTAVVEFLKSK